MKRLAVLGAVAAGVAALFAAPGLADGVGPPSGTIYAFDRAYLAARPGADGHDLRLPGLPGLCVGVRGRTRYAGLQRRPLEGRRRLRHHKPAHERGRRGGHRELARRHGHPLRVPAKPGLTLQRDGSLARPVALPCRLRASAVPHPLDPPNHDEMKREVWHAVWVVEAVGK
jgi:hypothetical protein